jgi:hypothetical protein
MRRDVYTINAKHLYDVHRAAALRLGIKTGFPLGRVINRGGRAEGGLDVGSALSSASKSDRFRFEEDVEAAGWTRVVTMLKCAGRAGSRGADTSALEGEEEGGATGAL